MAGQKGLKQTDYKHKYYQEGKRLKVMTYDWRIVKTDMKSVVDKKRGI